MDLTALLEYQKTDIELRKLLDEVERHDASKKMQQAKKEFALSKEQLTLNEQEAGSILSYFTKASASFEEYAKKTNELTAKYDELSDSEEDEKLKISIAKEIEILREKLVSLEKEISLKKAESEKVISAYLKAQDSARKMKAAYTEFKAQFEQVKKAKEPQINDFLKVLKEKEVGIDKELFTKYKELTAEKRYPAVVEGRPVDNGKKYSCGGCGLEVSQSVKDALLEKGVCRCETCRRIIYKK